MVTKCLRLDLFRLKPSMFQVIAFMRCGGEFEDDTFGSVDSEERGGFEKDASGASAKLAELSEDLSLKTGFCSLEDLCPKGCQ